MPSLIKKYIMALTGLALLVFVFFHMLGNLQVFLPPDAINAYAYFLHHQLPVEVLWLMRGGLLLAVVLHIWMAVLLVLENRAARPIPNAVEKSIQASAASRFMAFSGSFVLFYILFHILHLTVQNIYPEFQNFVYDLDGKEGHDLYATLIYGFSSKFWYVSAVYIVGMAFLCWHLSHGVSSLFQSLGLRNEVWRGRLDRFAGVYAIIVFLGFVSIPAAVLLSEQEGIDVLPTKSVLKQVEKWDGQSSIYLEYSGHPSCCITSETE